jgi:hypothetical protein
MNVALLSADYLFLKFGEFRLESPLLLGALARIQERTAFIAGFLAHALRNTAVARRVGPQTGAGQKTVLQALP